MTIKVLFFSFFVISYSKIYFQHGSSINLSQTILEFTKLIEVKIIFNVDK